ncbi:MAG: STAS domain-containing protein, partial [Streptosporangiaceae bacterium]
MPSIPRHDAARIVTLGEQLAVTRWYARTETCSSRYRPATQGLPRISGRIVPRPHYASGATSVIEAPDSFDIYSAPAVRELAIQLQEGGATAIVFDMGGVTFMDNTALGVIVGAHKRLRSAGGEGAAVAAASERVARCFEV